MPQPDSAPRPAGDFPVRQPHARLVQPGGRHRRPVPASLPEGTPALILAVPSSGDDGLAGPTAEIATILRVDNPALDVRTARIDHGGRTSRAGLSTRRTVAISAVGPVRPSSPTLGTARMRAGAPSGRLAGTGRR